MLPSTDMCGRGRALPCLSPNDCLPTIAMAEQIEAIPRLWYQCIDGVPCPARFEDRVRVLEKHFFGVISREKYRQRVSTIYEHMRRMVIEQGHCSTRKKKTCKKGSPDDVQQPEKSDPAVILVALHEMHDPLEGCRSSWRGI